MEKLGEIIAQRLQSGFGFIGITHFQRREPAGGGKAGDHQQGVPVIGALEALFQHQRL